MMKDNTIRTKIIKRFYGIAGEYDEYKEREVNRIGNNAFIGLWIYFILSTAIAALFATKYPLKTLWIYLGANGFVSIFLVTSYIVYASKKTNLTEVEVAETDFKMMKKKVLKSSVLSVIMFGILIYFWDGITYYFSDNISI